MTTRVLHLLPHPGGGAETYISYLERLEGFAHERLYLSSDPTPRQALISLPKRWPGLRRQLGRTDLVHCHGDAVSLLTAPAPRSRPTVMTTHGLHLLRRQHGVRLDGTARALRIALARAAAVICTSDAERVQLDSILRPQDGHKLHVIRNGVELAPGADQRNRISLRKQLGVAADAVLGLCIGSLEVVKDPLLAARAAERVSSGGTRFELAFAGDGSQAPVLKALGSRAVKVLGYRSDIPELLDAADFLVHPSHREGLPYSVLEAMSHSLPVVGANCPGTAEAVGDAGLLFPPGDVEALGDAITRLAGNHALRMSLAEAARARVAKCFGLDVFLRRTDRVYRHVLLTDE